MLALCDHAAGTDRENSPRTLTGKLPYVLASFSIDGHASFRREPRNVSLLSSLDSPTNLFSISISRKCSLSLPLPLSISFSLYLGPFLSHSRYSIHNSNSGGGNGDDGIVRTYVFEESLEPGDPTSEKKLFLSNERRGGNERNETK